jgi:hypothetical protein
MSEKKPENEKIIKDEKYFDSLRRRFDSERVEAEIKARLRADISKTWNETPFQKKLREQK